MSSSKDKTRKASGKGKQQHQALSLSPRNSRHPAVDMSNISDVSTLVCVELSRAIMTRPEVNTGSLFASIAASRNNVNKSDAVLVITAAILESIGSKRAAQKMLDNSATVSRFYDKMNLRDDVMRDSFVIMLFALAPEFVKMIESAVKVSIERVQSITDAPHASSKMLEAAGELVRSESITTTEHNAIMSDFAKGRNIPALESTFVSAGIQQDDNIQISDSASNIGHVPFHFPSADIKTSDIMDYLHRTKPTSRTSFSGTFPGAIPPVSVSLPRGRMGIGFTPQSIVTVDDDNESSISKVMNTLLPPRRTMPRRRVTTSDLENSRMMTTNMIKSPSASSDETMKTAVSNFQWQEAMVTREDITEQLKNMTVVEENKSLLPTVMSEEDEAKLLLSLL